MKKAKYEYKMFYKIIMLMLLWRPGLMLASNNLILEEVTIISPQEKGITYSVGNIYIRSGKIEKITSQQSDLPNNYKRISGKGLYAIPGLIDSHVHVDSIPGIDDEDIDNYREMVAAYKKQMPRSYLYYGYTTLVDLSKADIGQFNLQPVHPDIYDCGGGVTIENGYPITTPSTQDNESLFLNIYQDTLKPKSSLKDKTAIASTKKAISNGAVCIKTYFEPGFGEKSSLPLPSQKSINDIAMTAHANKLSVFIHANSLFAQQLAVRTNIDNMAHGMWNWGYLDGEEGLPNAVKNVLDEVINNNIGYQPTVQVPMGLIALAKDDYFRDKNLLKVLPRSLFDWYQTKNGQWYAKNLIGKNTKEKMINKMAVKVEQVKRSLKYLADNNAKLLFGTDTPSCPTYGNLPGYNGYLEIQQWYSAGVSLEIILKAATINNAKELRLDHLYGSIESGKIANILLLKENPLRTIRAYDSIDSIILHGKIYKREIFLASPF